MESSDSSLHGNTLDCRSRVCGFESHQQQKLKYLSCARSLGLLSPFGKWILATDSRGPPQSWHLKYGSMFFADWLWSVIAPVLWLKTLLDLLDSTYTSIAYAHLTAPHTCDYMGYVCHAGHAVRSSKNHLRLFGLEYAKFSLHEKWKKCPHPYRTNGLNTIDRWIIYPGVGLGFHGRDISYKIHSFINS